MDTNRTMVTAMAVLGILNWPQVGIGAPPTPTDSGASAVIKYDGNGNTGGNAPPTMRLEQGKQKQRIAPNLGRLTRIPATGRGEAYKFGGWNTRPDGRGEDFAAGKSATSLSGKGDVTLYAKWVPFVLRDVGPAGGWVFYDKGRYSSGWRYLEAAPTDQPRGMWGATNITVDTEHNEVGKGKSNTQRMLDSRPLGSQVAKTCDDYSVVRDGRTYDDWFLPSKDEAWQMCWNLQGIKQERNNVIQNRDVPSPIGGFSAREPYWTSTSYSGNTFAWSQDFSTAIQSHGTTRRTRFLVRPIRAF
ncbi:MAG: InlB B-repeat-containing protein [Polyangiaceae bacterium]|nr:InlB B-repeat-containing protein [Polyangiaceae bacterium]